ncbi:ABC transporter permease [Bifidobacterium sp. ESL0745]|uniref:ABC transporter permease n=1 Tax=Bifidobacterium sp. ESL0745 TaxID=2983226 RepID=UPI0023F99E75|nr:ABC transporter permease [Bifidobacterium sp. ESL0745]MDF7665289.1 ABC transporter permease [Bifidobacterium sp. ESL0745]
MANRSATAQRQTTMNGNTMMNRQVAMNGNTMMNRQVAMNGPMSNAQNTPNVVSPRFTDGNRKAAKRLPKPSVMAAFRWEIRKAGNLWYWIATVLFDLIGMFNGFSQYVDYRKDFEAQGVTWAAVWGQAILLPSMVFMPILVAAFASQIESNEHVGRNWQRLNASGTASTAIAGKMLHGLLASLLTVAVFEAEFLIVGKVILGFDLRDVGPFLLRGVPMMLAVWAIMTLTQAISTKFESFAGTMSVVLVLTLFGCVLSLIVPSLTLIYPFSLITGASAARDLGNIVSSSSIMAATLMAAFWVIVGGLIFRKLTRKAV